MHEACNGEKSIIPYNCWYSGVENLTMLHGLQSHGSENLSPWNATLPTSQATIAVMVLSSFDNGKPRCREKQQCALGKPLAEHRITPPGWGPVLLRPPAAVTRPPLPFFSPILFMPLLLKYVVVFFQARSHEILIHMLVKTQIHYISLSAFIH